MNMSFLLTKSTCCIYKRRHWARLRISKRWAFHPTVQMSVVWRQNTRREKYHFCTFGKRGRRWKVPGTLFCRRWRGGKMFESRFRMLRWSSLYIWVWNCLYCWSSYPNIPGREKHEGLKIPFFSALQYSINWKEIWLHMLGNEKEHGIRRRGWCSMRKMKTKRTYCTREGWFCFLPDRADEQMFEFENNRERLWTLTRDWPIPFCEGWVLLNKMTPSLRELQDS